MTKTLKATTGKKNERGFSLLETMIASVIMLVGISGLMALFTIAAVKNAGQGDQATRTTEYAQDKMEQLLALPFGDTNSQAWGKTTIISSGTGYVSGTGLATGGSLDTSNPAVNYVDYVDSQGAISNSATGAMYIREWTVAPDATGRPLVKTITVLVKAQHSVDVLAASTTLIAFKESY